MEGTAEIPLGKIEKMRGEVATIIRARLKDAEPKFIDYATPQSRGERFIAAVFNWSKAAIFVIALLAAAASSVRTVQTASEIYSASGSHEIGTLLAAIAFTVATEGALFVVALAQAKQKLQWKIEGRKRHVVSLRTILESILVRIGILDPGYWGDTERDNLGIVILAAFSFAVLGNLYMGMRPLWEAMEASVGEGVSLQTFWGLLGRSSAQLQMTFFIDFAAAIFPPIMAMYAGHLTANFAAEISEKSSVGDQAYRQAHDDWAISYRNPLDTADGIALLEQRLQNYQETQSARRLQTSVDNLQTRPQQALPAGKQMRMSRDEARSIMEQTINQMDDFEDLELADQAKVLMSKGLKRATAYNLLNERKEALRATIDNQ